MYVRLGLYLSILGDDIFHTLERTESNPAKQIFIFGFFLVSLSVCLYPINVKMDVMVGGNKTTFNS